MPYEDDSLDRDVTRAGAFPSPVTAERSLGEQPTTGGVSSVSDLVGSLGAFDDGMEIVDLSARYTVEGTLGQGGMGEVLLATDTRLKRKVAIKRIHGRMAGNSKSLQRFLTEAQSIARAPSVR